MDETAGPGLGFHGDSVSTMTASLDKLCIDTIRTLSMDAVQKANSGHPGTPMALAPMAYTLWTKFLKHNPRNPHWADRDRFVLSCGHASMLIYSLLHLSGYDLPMDELVNFRQWGSKTPGHPEFGHTAGIETTTGPLGQGVGNAVGMAIAERWLASHFNRPGFEIVNHHTYAIVSDGDIMEGVAQEAASIGGHLGLGKLICLYDDNKITIEGDTDLAFTEDVGLRFEAYGWHVLRVEDGEDLAALHGAIELAKAQTHKPSLIVIRTVIGYPSPAKQGSHEAHGSPLGFDEVKATKRILGWDPEAHFVVPQDAAAEWRKSIHRGEAQESEWNTRFAQYQHDYPELAAEFGAWMKGELGESSKGWEAALPAPSPAEGKAATRETSGKVLNAVAPKLQNLIGGSADLAPSNNTILKGGGDFGPHAQGRNFHWGVREHGMGACLNGMALHGGLRVYGATFLIFSDYMRPSVRLAALMGLPVTYVWTHDSIGLGEDGPTHQPIEQIMTLRMIPNMLLLRPADATETVEAWRTALLHKTGPVGLSLSRQKLPILDRTKLAPASLVSKGAYVLAEASGDAQILLMATGSEVHLALDARERLEGMGIPTRVVSMPSWELFAKQPQAYRDEVLPPAITARISIEAGTTFGWQRWVGEKGAMIGVDHFGASAPAEVLYEKFGISVENIVATAKGLLG